MNALHSLGLFGAQAALLALAAGAQQKAETNANLNTVATSSNRFAVELYRELGTANAGKNVFLSPASISTALSMTYEGAAENTRTQMAGVLHFEMPDAERREGYAALLKALTAAPDKHYKLHTANALWGNKKNLLPEFVKIMDTTYGSAFHEGLSVPAINKWASDETEGKIKDLLHAGDIDALTRLILTNAIYFKGDWVNPFRLSDTEDKDFHLANGQAVKTPLMFHKAHFRYTEDGSAQAVELPYKDGDLSMLVILPHENLAEFERDLSEARLHSIRDALQSEEVLLYLPRFKFSARTYMENALEKLGMNDAFNAHTANFSGMNGKRDLYIGHVIHEAYIDVNELGSEAAAATSVGFQAMAMRGGAPKTFRADHPFLFLIVHKASGTILFMGRVENPAA